MRLPRVPSTILGIGSRTRAAAEDTSPIERILPAEEPARTSTVDNAIYQDGRRVVSPRTRLTGSCPSSPMPCPVRCTKYSASPSAASTSR